MEQVDGDVWDTGLRSEIISFFSDTNVAIQKVDDAFSRVNSIDKQVITNMGWGVQVRCSYQSTEWLSLSLIK